MSHSPRPPLFTAPFLRVLAAQFSIGFGFSSYFLLPKYAATELHADASTIGLIGASALIANVAVSPWIGRLLDRHGRRLPLMAGALLSLFSALGMMAVEEVGLLLYALRIAQGVAFSLAFNAAGAAAADLAPSERLGQAIGYLGVSALVTNALAPTLAEYVAHTWGWPPVFLIPAGAAIVSLLLGAGLSSTAPSERDHGDANADGGVLAPLYAMMVTGVAFGTLITFAQPYALDLGRVRVAGYFVGYTVGAMIVRLGFGALIDAWDRRRLAQLALFAYGVVVLSTSQLRPHLLELFGFAFGLAHGFLYPVLAAMIVSATSQSHRGSALTNANAAFNAGAGGAALGCGWLARAHGYPFVFASIGAITMLSVAALTRGRRIPLAQRRG